MGSKENQTKTTETKTVTGKLLHIIEHYGLDDQFYKSIEEAGEYISAASELLAAEGKGDKIEEKALKNVMEELADLIIMTKQMRLIFGIKEIDNLINYKIKRTMKRIEQEIGNPNQTKLFENIE